MELTQAKLRTPIMVVLAAFGVPNHLKAKHGLGEFHRNSHLAPKFLAAFAVALGLHCYWGGLHQGIPVCFHPRVLWHQAFWYRMFWNRLFRHRMSWHQASRPQTLQRRAPKYVELAHDVPRHQASQPWILQRRALKNDDLAHNVTRHQASRPQILQRRAP